MIDYSIWDDGEPASASYDAASSYDPPADINFDAVKKAHPIADVIGQVVVLKRSGREHKGLCPFHAEKTPSFTVYEDRAHCFGCGWDGDVIQFVQDIDGLASPKEAIERLTGGDIPQMTPALRKKIAADKKRREEKQAMQQAQARLEAQRRYDKAEPIGDFIPEYLFRKGLTEHPPFLRREGDNLLLPLFDDEGEVLSVQSIRPDSAKRFHAGARVLGGRLILGVDFGRVIICEGYATGASIWEATAECVWVAFSKANIHVLARECHEAGIQFAIAADTNAVAEMQDLARETGHPLVVSPDCGSDFNDQHAAKGADSVRATFAAALRAHATELASLPEGGSDEDHAPLDLWATHNPPTLPRGLLPRVIEDFAFVQAEVMGADPGGLAMAALACAGSMIHDDVRLKVKRHERWSESARIWVALVGGPSVLKSPVMRVAGAHIGAIDTGRVIEHNRDKQRWLADKSDGMKTDPPSPPERLRINDTTVEAAQEILKNTNRGILCVQDELAGWFASMERNGKGKGGDNSFWLQAFNGGHFSVDRVGRGSVPIENLSVSLIGGIQPDKIRSIMGDAADDGMMQRFFPIVLRDGGYDMDVETPDVRVAYENALDGLYALKAPETIFGQQPLEFSDEAQEYRNELARQHVDMVKALAQVNGKIASHIGKYNGLFARLCVIWHCLEHVGGEDAISELPREVSEVTARRVGEFMHGFLFSHLKAFYVGVLDMSDDMQKLRDLGGYILAYGKESVTMRDLQRSTRALKSLDRQGGAKVFEALEAMGWLEQTGKRQDAPQWIVNPAVHKLYEDKGKAHKERAEATRSAIMQVMK